MELQAAVPHMPHSQEPADARKLWGLDTAVQALDWDTLPLQGRRDLVGKVLQGRGRRNYTRIGHTLPGSIHMPVVPHWVQAQLRERSLVGHESQAAGIGEPCNLVDRRLRCV
jgi:hypothetical protein